MAELSVSRPGSPQGQRGSPEGRSGGCQSSPYWWIRPWFDPDDGVRLHIFENAPVKNRSRRSVPAGYRCNAFGFAAASAPTVELCRLLVEAKARSSCEG
ncbi:unnamed protein product [Miscanthus lutarioriparius]|uniref:Uncharacterized protein n=1 Tax=Miscanthus lutarioriparius TaxID=422564 RepID=A0A811M8R9_9POAL|nr:unnamed protein product [Miscanthus lutarioriparius]